MNTYRTISLKTVYPQLHHGNEKLCMKIRPISIEEVPSCKHAKDLQPDTRLRAGDVVFYADQGLFYEVKFLKGR